MAPPWHAGSACALPVVWTDALVARSVMAKDDKRAKDDKPAKAAKRAKPGKDPLASFDIENPELPEAIAEAALGSGGYPYDSKIKRKTYDEDLVPLQIELLKFQAHVEKTGQRVVVLFEGRDTSGKGGAISTILERMNPRHARAVALTKPTEAERGQWYFQRYVQHLPTAGDLVLFDRSWYNRAGVERVMGFCTPEQHADFLRDAPEFEGLLVRDGVKLLKLYLTVGREMQLLRFHERKHNPLKQWKLTDIDLAAIEKWDDYTAAETEMFRFTHTPDCPWTVVRANDQRRMRLEVIRKILSLLPYSNKDPNIATAPDPEIVTDGPEFLKPPAVV
jgi:polyphosphate kinase 2